MRVWRNNREIGGLDERLARRLRGPVSDRAVEGVALSTAAAIRVRGRELMWLLLGTAAVVVLLLSANVLIIAFRAPQAVATALPASAGSAVFAIIVIAVIYWLTMVIHRRRVAARAGAL